ncbi:MAG: SAM-dependent methyltransferase, partial [Candidatus Dormibacteria bacterium]
MPEIRETYTHGHHESVLRSHRWRTAANSAAYLLDRLGPGTD